MGVKWLVYTSSKGLDGAHINMHNHMTRHVIAHSLLHYIPYMPSIHKYIFEW